MNKRYAFAALTAVAMAVMSQPSQAADIDITVKVSGFEKTTGEVFVALYDEAGWTSKTRITAAHAPVAAEGVTVHLMVPAAGKYGIKAFHDLNGNGELDKSFVGIPKEPYAFSNHATGTPPDFADAAFDVGTGGATQEITLK